MRRSICILCGPRAAATSRAGSENGPGSINYAAFVNRVLRDSCCAGSDPFGLAGGPASLDGDGSVQAILVGVAGLFPHSSPSDWLGGPRRESGGIKALFSGLL